jgi:hypothetical protein
MWIEEEGLVVRIKKFEELSGLKCTEFGLLETDIDKFTLVDDTGKYEDEATGVYDIMFPVEELMQARLQEEVDNCIRELISSMFVGGLEPASQQ